MSNSFSFQSKQDAFGNEIDSLVGYARGSILQSNDDEIRRLQHCRRIASKRVIESGVNSIGIFTGNKQSFPLEPFDVESFCDEWIGAFLIEDVFRTTALDHLGGNADDEVLLFNRTSAGLLCAISVLSESNPVVSIAPRNSRSHASVQRGCMNARIHCAEVSIDQNWKSILASLRPKLVIITAVTSKLEYLSEQEINEITEAAHIINAVVLLDDAYGARIRPAVFGGASSLALDVDLAITSCDKAGLHGPRAGLLGGRRHLVEKLNTIALEWGLEGRAPMRVATLRALQRYSHKDLLAEAQHGQALTTAMQRKFGLDLVTATPLGPLFSEEKLLRHIKQKRESRVESPWIVPCEITAALGVLLLRDYGILTVNTHGQPGASVTLRLKPTGEALTNVGGVIAVANALESAINQTSIHLDDESFFSRLILGK